MTIFHFFLYRQVRTAAMRADYLKLAIQKKGDHMKDIFWLSRPDFYFEVVQFVIMLIALYLALWLAIFSGAEVVGYWKAIAIIPGLLCVVNYLYVVKTAALLKALYSVDYEALDQVFQQTDASRALEQSIRQKLLAKMQLSESAGKKHSWEFLKKKVYDVFCEIDYDNGGLVNRSEFSLYLSRMGISLNRKQWKETFRNIDLDGSELLSFAEFFAFIFPEHHDSNQSPPSLEAVQKKVVDVELTVCEAPNSISNDNLEVEEALDD